MDHLLSREIIIDGRSEFSLSSLVDPPLLKKSGRRIDAKVFVTS